jgi:hypothetical protein
VILVATAEPKFPYQLTWFPTAEPKVPYQVTWLPTAEPKVPYQVTWLPTAEPKVPYQVTSCEICRGRNSIGMGFSSGPVCHPPYLNFIIAPFTFVTIPCVVRWP